MAQGPLSRRGFVTAAGLAAAPQARQPVVASPYGQAEAKAQQTPIRIVTMNRFEPHEVAEIRGASPVPLEVEICAGRDEFRQKLRDAEVVYGAVRGEDLDYAPRLKWVQWGAAGVEGMDAKLRSSPLVVTNFARTFAPGISETAMGLLLCLTRGITKYYMPMFYKRQLKAVGTVKSDDHVELGGKTMGIAGLGGIGSAVARRAHYGFDMRVVATDAKPLPKPEYVAELHDPTWFRQMAAQVDVLVSAAPHTKETDRMFNEQVFRGMKRTAYFLALSRGDLFDDMALVRALKEGWIAGAGLDVFPTEPPPPDHPIYDCPNVVMTPHTSGWSPDRQVRLVALFAENVRRYAIGQPLINVVDKAKGY